jgi:outer membrane protein TolC
MPSKRRPILAAIAAALAFLLVSSEGAAENLTLEEAIRLALAHNERAKIAQYQVDAAEGDLEAARSDFLPSLTFGAAVTAQPYKDKASRYVTGSGTLTLRQPLLNPSAIPSYARARHSLDAAKHDATETRRILAYDTARTFIQVLAAERVVKAAEGRLERAKANLDNTHARVQAQLTSSNDATRTRLDMASSLREMAQTKGNLDRARLALRLIIDKDVEAPLTSPEGLSRAAQGFTGDAARMTRAALGQRPDLKAAQAQVLAFKKAADETLYQLAPSIDLIGQVRANPDPLTGERWHDESVSLSLSWTIYDGGARYGVRRARVAQTASVALQERQLARAVDNEVRAALVALDAARATLRVAEEAMTTARANSDETQVLYQQGLARAIELTDANARTFEAEVNLASARLELMDAYLEVRFAQGLDPIEAAPSAGGQR